MNVTIYRVVVLTVLALFVFDLLALTLLVAR